MLAFSEKKSVFFQADQLLLAILCKRESKAIAFHYSYLILYSPTNQAKKNQWSTTRQRAKDSSMLANLETSLTLDMNKPVL